MCKSLIMWHVQSLHLIRYWYNKKLIQDSLSSVGRLCLFRYYTILFYVNRSMQFFILLLSCQSFYFVLWILIYFVIFDIFIHIIQITLFLLFALQFKKELSTYLSDQFVSLNGLFRWFYLAKLILILLSEHFQPISRYLYLSNIYFFKVCSDLTDVHEWD